MSFSQLSNPSPSAEDTGVIFLTYFITGRLLLVLSGVQLGQEQLQTFRLVGDAPAEQAKDLIAPAAQVDVVGGIVVVLQDCVFQTVQAGGGSPPGGAGGP